MPLLFSYGTLQQENVQLSTFGRRLHGEKDELVGFERSLVRIDDPGVVETSGQAHHPTLTFSGRADHRVGGTVFEITGAELASADEYERRGGYKRISVESASGKRAWLYVIAAPEAWLRGPVRGIPDQLQPVAHALIQACEDAHALVRELRRDRFWARPGGAASPGFHLQHIAGVIDRLFTYARGEALSRSQMETLASEGIPPASNEITVRQLLDAIDAQVERALTQLRNTPPSTLGDVRAVGRKQLPSTVFGLLFHAAEHVQRHIGQLLVTVRVVDDAQHVQ